MGMKNTLTYTEQLTACIRRAKKQGDYLAVLYYRSKVGTTVACASWEAFKGSWAAEQWIADHRAEADALQANR